MDGIRMAGEIKAIDAEIAVIALTAYTDTSFLLSAVELGFSHYVMKPIDLDRLFESIEKSLQVLTLKRQVNEQNEEIRLNNILRNAWKYTGKREEAVIEFGATEIGGKQVCFVRDNGSGFDQADADKLFRPFQRLPGSEEFRGSGIGLATVDRIIRRHGGKVWAEGEPGKGARFYFTLSAE